MVLKSLQVTARNFFIAVIAFGLAGCRTLEYRQVQRDFQSAVQADNTGEPFGSGHEQIVRTLSPDYINQLDRRLRPNAWMLRAVSSWRSGNFSNATSSAEQGIDAAGKLGNAIQFSGSRDEIVLQMIPALVIDSEQTRRLGRRTNAPLSAEDYKPIERAYKTALAQMDDASGRFSGNTSEDVLAYYYYQRWRLLQHWTAAIGQIGDGEALAEAFSQAKAALGKSLEDAIKEARDKIPAGQPLRALIRAQGGQ